MRVLFNATAALSGSSGEVHTVGLLGHVAVLGTRHEFVLLTTPEQEYLRKPLKTVVSHHVTTELGGRGLVRTVRAQLRLEGLRRKTGADVVYNKGNFYAPLAGPQVTFLENSNPFTTLRLGEPFAYRARNRLLRLMSDRSMQSASAVIFPTEHARMVMTSRSPLRVPSFVIPYGCELTTTVAAPAERPFILCVSSLLPYKNLTRVIDAASALRADGRFTGELVVIGVSGGVVAGGGYYHTSLMDHVTSLGLERDVRLLPAVPPSKLAELYAGASCLIMASLEESFGIPLIEAMAAGTPVVAGRLPKSLAGEYFMPYEEICADAAEYFDPFNAAACADAVMRALEPARARQLRARGLARASLYSWRAAAEKTVAMLDALQ